MGLYRKKPLTVEAMQWTGDNFDEITLFCGFRRTADGHEMNAFNPIATFLMPDESADPKQTAELWVEANKGLLPLVDGEWVIKDSLGFYPCQADKFAETYDEVDELPEPLPAFSPNCGRCWNIHRGYEHLNHTTAEHDGWWDLMRPDAPTEE
jgi:hypothetical protein